jgi:hypothetical protein
MNYNQSLGFGQIGQREDEGGKRSSNESEKQ